MFLRENCSLAVVILFSTLMPTCSFLFYRNVQNYQYSHAREISTSSQLRVEFGESMGIDQLPPEEQRARSNFYAGIEYIAAAEIEKALEYFDDTLSFDPERYLWHRGMVLFFLGRYEEAAEQLARDIKTYEKDFEKAATEESIFHAACMYKLHGPIEGRALSLNTTKNETRPVFTKIHQLFLGDIDEATVLLDAESTSHEAATFKDNLFYSRYLLGLYYDACGEEAVAKNLVTSVKEIRHAGVDKVWWALPDIHAKYRQW